MKLLDRYILKQFIMTMLFGLLAFTAIFVIIDLLENLDDFLDHSVDTPIIFQYYLAFIPEIIKLMTPVAILLSSLFVTGKLSSNNIATADVRTCIGRRHDSENNRADRQNTSRHSFPSAMGGS